MLVIRIYYNQMQMGIYHRTWYIVLVMFSYVRDSNALHMLYYSKPECYCM